ncbi:MAG: TIGR00341 family protein [Saprospiraceae bacterium]|nr:TIGR00341 family protein [Saprospiraceae bacterium]
MAQKNISAQSALESLQTFFRQLFNLSEGKASERATIEDIRQNVAFKGANLWILIFAILICSIGLDVNSTAVVIGAMLISPLMGPIMGIGLGVGIYDFDLIVKALRNLGIAALMSVLTSALYFWISPLDEAQSELLARTSPNLWDVLIAFFGGFAGIVAGSRKEKSNAIPGVAIATALMPPLCTAGFGLATGELKYFLGAFYLFWINSVFISLSTYIIVRALRFKPKEFIDPLREKRVKRYIALFIILTIIPSIYTAVNVVQETFFKRNANEFIDKEFVLDHSRIISKRMTFQRQGGHIDITIFGEPIPDEEIQKIREKMPNYKLQNCQLNVIQASSAQQGLDVATVEQLNQQLRTGIIEDLYKKNEEQIKDRDDKIHLLESEIIQYRSKEVPINDLINEIKAINNNITEVSIAPAILSHTDSIPNDTLYLAYLNFKTRPSRSEVSKLEDWLKARIKADKIKIVRNY